MNSLRFAHTAPLEVYDEATPRAARQLMGAFFLQTAYTLEAIDALRKLNQEMRTSQTWQAEVVPLFRDAAVHALERQSVRDLRNQIVFHFDLGSIQRGLANLPATDSILISTAGRARKDIYFPLADEAAVAFAVTGAGLDRSAWMAEVATWLSRATDLSIRIAEIVESVVVEIVGSYGLRGNWQE